MISVLITGAAGFTARYLADELRQAYGDAIALTGIDRVHPTAHQSAQFHACDLLDEAGLTSLLDTVRPTHIYHLAGSFTNDYRVDYEQNVLAAKTLFDAVLRLRLASCRLLIVGSAAEYGRVDSQGRDVPETTPQRPITTYGLTKLFQTHLARHYADAHGLSIVIVRPFNLIGPGISNRLFVGRLYEQIQAIKRGTAEEIHLGDISEKRDYVDVRDAVRGYRLAIESGCAGEVYNVGSGRLVSIERLLELFLRRCAVPRSSVRTATGPLPPDGLSFCANLDRLQSLGWTPAITIEESVNLFASDAGLTLAARGNG